MTPYGSRMSGVLWTTGSSAIVGALGLLGLVVAARGLGAADYTTFAVIWGVVYGLGGAFAGLQQEVTRSATTGRPCHRSPRMAVWVLVLSVPLGLFGGVVATYVLGPGNSWAAVVIAIGLIGMGMLTFVCGVLAAQASWHALAALLVVDAVVRTTAIALMVGVGRAEFVAPAIVSGLVLWSLLLPLPWFRQTIAQRLPGEVSGFVRHSLVAMLSAGCQALVVAGIPTLVAAFGDGKLAPEAGGVVAAATIIRSAFLLLVYGYRPMVLRHFLSTDAPGAALVRAWGWCGVAGALYVLVLWGLGPRVLLLTLGSGYAVSSAVCAALAAGTAALGLLVVSGLALAARGRHLAAGAGWLIALLAAAVIVAIVDADSTAFVVAATVPPWVGVLAHGLLLRQGNTSRGVVRTVVRQVRI